MARKEALISRTLKILEILKGLYPEAKCSLDFKNPFQLLVSTILSAQCTDERVNKTTPALFARFPDATALAKGKLPEIEKLIRPTGFFKNKAKSLLEMSKTLVEHHGASVPKTMEELVKLRGVGRKTANVVLGNAYGVPGLPVDTHVGRVSRRLGLTKELNPVKVEEDLMALLPPKEWVDFSHCLIFHGRAICAARKPLCESCPIASLCPKLI